MRLWVPVAIALAACSGDFGDDTSGDDTGDTSDSGDTDDSGDSDTGETGDTGDTSDLDTGDTGGSDTADLPTPDDTLDARRAFPEGCTNIVPLRPDVDEIGAWASARITPPSTPYTVREVWFAVLGGFWQVSGTGGTTTVACDADGPFHFRVMVVSGAVPPDGDTITPPTAAFLLDAPSVAVDAQHRYIGGLLDAPIVLQAGESLVVALDSNQPGDARSCFKTCVTTTDAPPDTQYWTSETDPKDWTWDELGDLAQGNPESNLPKYHFWAELRGDHP